MQVSIVIPLLNEQESIEELYQWIIKVLSEHKFSYEIFFIDDGSTDNSWQIIENLSRKDKHVKGIRFFKNYGKSQALHAGFEQTKGQVVITMDADLQDSPEEIPELYRLITQEKMDLISGWKKKRYDSFWTKNLPSKLFNWTARKTSKINLHDFNCGLKAYRQEVVKNIEIYGQMHRYTPVLVKNAGFTKIGEKIVKHQARKHGVSKFGKIRFVHGFLDLLSLWFLSKFGKNPMHFFGSVGALLLLIGIGSAGYIGIFKLYKLYTNQKVILITDNPWFYISLTTIIMGTQLFLTGFLGEIFIQNQSHKKRYKIHQRIGM